MFEHLNKISPATFDSIKRMIILGLLSAVLGNIRFSIIGISGGTSDAGEIAALISIAFMPHWIYALGIGVLVSLGAPHDFFIKSLILHTAAIPIAWFFLNELKKRVHNILLFGSYWFIFVIFLYFTVYFPLFTLSSLYFNSIQSSQLLETYLAIYSAVKFEIVITAIITTLSISFIILQSRYKKKSEFLRLAEEGAEIGFWHWDLRNNHTSYNKQWGELLGYSVSEVEKNDNFWESIIHPDDRKYAEKNLTDHLQKKIPYYQAEYRLKSKNGDYRWILARGNTVERDKNGQPLNMAGFHLDITEKIQLEEDNKNLQKQIFHSQKMESIGVLAGGVAHDFNNLLTVIKGYSDISLSSMEKSSPLYKNINEIKKAADRAENLTRQLLAFSRKQIYNAQLIEINALVKDMDKMLRRLIGEDIQISITLNNDLPKMMADKSQLEQIFVNLVVNARDAVNSVKKEDYTKKITIETGQKYLDKEYTDKHLGCAMGLYIYFSVSDNGIGMDEETKQKVFDPFFTTKEEFKGTGLGLSTVYGIVKQNNGSIYVYSEKDRGTLFKIFWPVSNEEIKSPKKTVENSDIFHGSESILLVEDDKSVSSFTKKALTEIGYRITTASNGLEALELIRSMGCTYNLIITDLIMPKLNGRDLIEKIKKKYPLVKVLYISGYTDNHIVHDGLLEKDINFLQKPYSIKSLAKKIRIILDNF